MNGETRSPCCAPVRSANGQCLPDRCGLEAAVASEDRPKRAVVSPADKCRWGKSRGEFRPCAILLAEASVAQSLDGSRLSRAGLLNGVCSVDGLTRFFLGLPTRDVLQPSITAPPIRRRGRHRRS